MTRLLFLPERHPGRCLACIGLLFSIAYTLGLVLLRKPDGRIVVGDAVHYYVYLRSALFDGDLHFRNDYVRLYGLRGGEEGTEWVYEPTATGHVRNMMSIGPPLVWAPLYATTAGVVGSARLVGVEYPLDGFGRLFQASAGYSGILASVLGAWLTYQLCSRLYGQRLAIWTTITLWLASSAVYYSVVSPTYSHAASMFAVSWLFYRWTATLDRQTPGRYAEVGALAGLVTLVRWQDAVFLIVPLVDAVYHLQAWGPASAGSPQSWGPALAGPVRSWRPALAGLGGSLGRAATNLAACAAAAFLVFSPQVMVWLTLYGRPVAMPQGSDWMQWSAPFVTQVLFSDWHGLFTWTPIAALAVMGLPLIGSKPSVLVRLKPAPSVRPSTGSGRRVEGPDPTSNDLDRHRHLIALVACAAFLVSLYANGSVKEWWAGEAYGARRFVSCFPLLALGLAAVAARLGERPRMLLGIAVAAIALNALLLLQYQAFMHGLRDIAPYPRGVYGLAVARFLVPFELIGWLMGR